MQDVVVRVEMASQHDSIPLGFFFVSVEASAGFALQTLPTGSVAGSQFYRFARTVGARSSRQNIPTRNVAKTFFHRRGHRAHRENLDPSLRLG